MRVVRVKRAKFKNAKGARDARRKAAIAQLAQSRAGCSRRMRKFLDRWSGSDEIDRLIGRAELRNFFQAVFSWYNNKNLFENFNFAKFCQITVVFW